MPCLLYVTWSEKANKEMNEFIKPQKKKRKQKR